MGLYPLIERRVRGLADFRRLDPVKRSLVGALTAAAGRCPEGRWLDVGAGSGVHREIFRHKAGTYVAIDPAPRGRGVLPGVGEALPFQAGSFDAAVVSEVLEHVEQPERVLAEVKRVLRPGGTLLVTVPFVFYEHEAPRDFSRLTRYGLRGVLERSGFEVLEVQPVCGIVAVTGIAGSMALLGTLGRLPGMWEPSLRLNELWMRAVVLPLDRWFDPGKRWAQGHWALARSS